MIRSDLHVHTSFCDGSDSPETIAAEAYRRGFASIGFSGHGYTSFDSSFCMSLENTACYISRIHALQEQYRDRMDVLLGIEKDAFSGPDGYSYDYVIASLHYIFINGEYRSVDESEESCSDTVRRYFGGDYLAFAKEYYRTLAERIPPMHADIIGHFDLITKFNENGKLFDTTLPEYRRAALEALATIAEEHPIFELNCGAIARGYRNTPYPEDFLLREIRSRGCDVILSSDSHSAKTLGFGFSEACKRLVSLGFDHVKVKAASGFFDVSISE